MTSRNLLALSFLALAGSAACGDDGTPSTPCELACGDHGTCVIRGGAETCLCERGYGGDACDACGDGFVLQGGACAPDPCEPINPCTAPHQTVCQVTDAGHGCACDADAQDHDGDGTCRPTCALAVQGLEAQACDDASGEALFAGTRTCDVVLAHDPGGAPVGTLYVRGEWNDWGLSQPLARQADGRWTIRLTLPAGHHAYKLFDTNGDRWFEDPANPYYEWIDGTRNSRLVVPDCADPLLRLVHQPESQGGAVRFKVQYVDGAGGAGLGTGGVTATRNGAPVTASLDRTTGVVTIADTGLAPGKYAYRFEASDAGGRRARRLYVPVWVEDRPFAWEDGILYFAMTDRFANGDPSNDDPEPGVDPRLNWQGGDFEGLRQQIERGYLDELGVNVLWISSVSQNGQGGFAGDFGLVTAYHSYWPASTGWTAEAPLAGVGPIEPHFGSLDEARELVRVAHAHGIRVLVDLVANHVHDQSPLWRDHQGDSPPWFNLPAVGCKESNWTQPITCWFAGYLPDLDHRNVLVMEAVIEHALWLVEELDLDGFRLDAVKHLVDDFSYSLRGRLAERLRWSGQRFYMVGETFCGEGDVDLLKRYIGPAQLDGQFDFPLYWNVLATLLREERDLRALEAMVAWNDTTYGDWAIMGTFLGNHDVCRALSHADGQFGDAWCASGPQQGWDTPPPLPSDLGPFQRLRLAWTFLLTSPGIPLIYYGDELGMAGAGDPDNRRFMTAADALSGPQQGTLAHVQALTAARAAHPALRRGARRTLHMASDGLLWAYALETAGDFAIVVLNRSGERRVVEVDVRDLQLADGAGLRDVLGPPVDLTVEAGRVSVALEGRSSALLVSR